MISRYKRLSSAKRRTLVPGERFLCMSLMYMRKKRGPNTVPWGTPERTGRGSDDWPSTTTCCVRFWRNDADQASKDSLMPISYIFERRVE